jgi:hypothetical protein
MALTLLILQPDRPNGSTFLHCLNIICQLLRISLPQNTCWIPSRNGIHWDISCYHRARTDNAIVANCHAREYNSTKTNVHVVTHRRLSALGWTVRKYGSLGAKDRIVANANQVGIDRVKHANESHVTTDVGSFLAPTLCSAFKELEVNLVSVSVQIASRMRQCGNLAWQSTLQRWFEESQGLANLFS